MQKLLPCLLVTVLSACSQASLSLIPLDGTPVSDLSRVSLIQPDNSYPALPWVLDGKPVHGFRVPSAFNRYAYVVAPGEHDLGVKGVSYPHPMIPQRLHCYLLHVDLQPGVRYVLKEDADSRQAVLIRADTAHVESVGALVDDPWVFVRDCKWD